MIDSILQAASAALETGNFMSFIYAYLAGILTSFTPCIYPIIPLTLAYFTSQTQEGKRNTFLLAFMYVLGMSFVYSLLGMIAGLTGSLFGRIATHHITLFIFANICLLLGLSMMDFFDIPLPGFLTSAKGGKKRGYLGSFLVGSSAGLVVGPCTTPVLALILTYVSKTQSVVLGGSLLFTFSLGLGTILLLLGISSGFIHKLPKSGKWMVYVKKGMGVLMILLAEYFFIKAGQQWF